MYNFQGKTHKVAFTLEEVRAGFLTQCAYVLVVGS
jgi:hypothetical protein